MSTSLFKFIIINFIIFSIVSCSPKGIPAKHTINIEYVVSTSTGIKSNIYESTSHTYFDNELFEPNQYKKFIFGYNFIGIFTDPNLMETFKIQSYIKETFTLYYAYEPIPILVEFDFKGGISSSGEPESKTFKYDDLLRTNVNLKLDEHIFLGFFMNTSSGERQISNQDGVLGNLKLNIETFLEVFSKVPYTLKLYAKYDLKTYNLELIYGQTAYEDKNIPLKSDEDISTLIPAKIDDIIDNQNNIYVRFVGWSLLETRNLPLQDTTITNSIKLYALWQPLIYINVIQEEPLILLPNQSVGTHLLDTPLNPIGHTFLHWKTPDGTIHFLNDYITIPSLGLRLDANFTMTDYSKEEWNLYLVYNRIDEYLISDDAEDEKFDIIDFIKLFNIDYQFLYNLGYRNLNVSLSFDIKEKNSGNQEIKIVAFPNSNEIIYKYSIDGFFKQDEYIKKNESFVIELNKFTNLNGFVVYFKASGWFNNDWYNKNLTVLITSNIPT